MSNFKNIILEVVNSIATVVINRPDKLNALNFATLEELEQAIDTIAEDKSIRGVIITGSGKNTSYSRKIRDS